MPKHVSRLCGALFLLIIVATLFACARTITVSQETGPLLDNVKISQASFNPSLNQEVAISYRLRRDAKINLQIFAPEGELVRTLVKNERRKMGIQQERWDGRDDQGVVVPDEAYSFVIEALDQGGSKKRYDPSVKNWSQFDTAFATISEETNTITYTLPKPCRTRIRMGIANGPLLHTLVDWKPRVAGEITEHWDGWDRGKALEIRDHPQFKMVITNIELPENTIIIYGNKTIDYISHRGPSKIGSPATAPAPLATMFSPRVKISFPMTKDYLPEGMPLVKNKILVRVELEDEDKVLLSSTPYEIVFFLDGVFYAEEPTGSSPYNWVWDLSGVKPGEHILTVNLISHNDQIGAASKKIKVKK